MKPFTARTIFIFNPFSRAESSRHALYVSHFSSSSSHPFQSSSNSAAFRRHEEESRNVRVSVWWDFENCSPSAGGNIFKIAQNITSALRASGIKGPIQMTAFGDMIQLSRTNQEALSATGINLTHIPHGGKNSADRSLLVDLMYWVSQNPPPSHLLLISGDRDFANTLHRLRMNNYNILLACPENSPSVLCSAASIMWNWNSLVKGDNLTGKYFNQPPDGPYGSWYGYYKVPLEDPFAVNQQPSEDLPDSCQEQKVGPVPKGVVKQIRRILSAYPKGIPITDLRAELGKTEVTLDKDLYGYKKFSKLLLSMPHIKLSGSDGYFYVRIVPQKNCEPTEGPSVGNSDEQIVAVSAKGNGKDKKLSISPEVLIEQKEVEPTKEVDTNAVDNKLYTKEKINRQSELQFLEKLQRKRLGDNEENSREGSRANSTVEETDVRSMNQDIAHQLAPASSSLSDNGKAMDGKVHHRGPASSSLSDNGKAKDGKVSEPGFIKKFIDWFKFWRTDPSTDILSEGSGKIPKEVAVDQVKNKLFSDDTFWTEMERFLDTSHGSDIVLRSKSRENIAENLQKEGPSILTSLPTSDLLHLLHLMITEKKWVEECISQPYPFKVIKPVKHSSLNNTSSSNGLSQIFMNPAKESESDVANQKQDNQMSSETSRNEMLADCQKLADEIVNEYPDGFNMGSFRRLFFQRFGYPLDFQNLGYQKLATLLQIMPGVKVEANFIYPSTKNTNGESPDSLKKDSNDLDSQWEELGPVAAKDSQPNDDYDTMADELISDSDEETKSSSSAKSVEKSGKMCSSSLNKEDSSLIRILDSWYSKNGDTGKGAGSESVEENVDGSSKDVTFLGGNSGRKQRPMKTYSFVSDKGNEDGSRDKLIDGILGSLKKSGESRLHS